MNEELARAASGEELRVDYTSIEKSLSELWRVEGAEGEKAVTRAALWNVLVHTCSPADHTLASETLSKVSSSVPQRTIVVRADPKGKEGIAAWISANCHVMSGQKQVCSEEVAIVAGGSRVAQVPPLVSALLIPDMPVAFWWVGDIPDETAHYVDHLLEPADRLIVDSRSFNSLRDLMWLNRVASNTATAPADLNWVRLEDWRAATAAIFDGPMMREKLSAITRVRLAANEGERDFFGDSVESLYYAAWLTAQTSDITASPIDFTFETVVTGGESGKLNEVHIEFGEGSEALIERDRHRGVLMAAVDGVEHMVDNVTRVLGRRLDELIVRQLKRPETDAVFVKVLPVAIEMASRIEK